MSREPRKHRPRARIPEASRNRLRREERVHSKTRHEPGMFWNRGKRSKYIGCKLVPALDKWLHQPAPGISVFPQSTLGGFEIPFQHNSRAAVERMSERSRGMNPFQAVILQRKGCEERRSGSQRIHRRSKIMHEAGQG